MTLLTSYALTSTFAGIPQLQCMGSGVSGNSAPSGVAGSIEIVNSTAKMTIRQTDPTTFTGIRSEMVFTPFALNDESWVTWECMIASEDWLENTGQIIIAQIHPEDTIVAAVNFSLYVKGRQLFVSLPLSDPPTLSTSSSLTPLGDLVFGKWYSFCLHSVWKNADTGMLEFYQDRKPVAKIFNRGTAYNLDTPYFKMGVYDGPHNADFGTKAAYFRNLKIYSGNDGYTTVMGSTPITQTALTT